MKRLHQIKISLGKLIMNGISDKNVILIILITIFFVFGLIFTAKSPERKVIDSPIMWKDEYINSSISEIFIVDSLDLITYSF